VTQAHPPQESSDIQTILPTRVTLIPPTNRHRSVAIETAARRLQIPIAELEAKIDQEVDEMLRVARLERRVDSLFPASPQLQRILTKEDCLLMLATNGYPSTGPMIGIYRWAADLGHATYNFVREEEGYEFLNAYD
jgi:hypothetical protein